MNNRGAVGLGAKLETQHIRPPGFRPARGVRIPHLGRILFTRDQGDANIFAREHFQSRLFANHIDGDGKLKHQYDLGSGNVQDNFVMALMHDYDGTTNNLAAPILTKFANRMYSGTGGTVNTYDVQLQTTAGPASGALTATQGYVAAGSSNGTAATILFVGTIAYTTTLAITEWGLFNAAVQGAQSTSTTNTWTAQAQASATWGTTLGASANAFAGYIAYLTSTTTGAFIISNTTGTSGLITVAVSPLNGFYLLTSAGGAGSTPSSNTSVSIYPLMSDHKTFSAINVVNGDSIQFSYQLQISPGG